MSDSDSVTMNIPENNPLFQWITSLKPGEPIPYVNVSVGDVSARLKLTAVDAIQHRMDEFTNGHDLHTLRSRAYLETSWRLLRDSQ